MPSTETARLSGTRRAATVYSGQTVIILQTQGNTLEVCIAHNADFKSVAFEVQMTLLGGTEGGILLYAGGPTTYYFRISKDGNYALLACTGTETSCNRTLTSGFSSWITSGRGQSNLLAVVAKGDGIQLYVNNQRIDDINDATSLHGQIGVVADTYSEVVFRNAKVWIM